MPATQILVVDDDADIRENVRDILEDIGYEVDTAADGEAALRLIRNHHYDIALLDYIMPGINGLELYKQIRQLRPDIVAIMITAHFGLDCTHDAIDAGTWRVLSKPLDIGTLLLLIEQASQWPIVLVVDDDPAFCDNLWETLRLHEYRVDIANTESEGIEKAEQFVYQTAIVDLRLNQGDGRHVIEIVHRLRPDAKLLVVTGQRDEINSLPEGVKGLCHKPVDMDELLRLLQ